MVEEQQSVASQSESCLYLEPFSTLPAHFSVPPADQESFIFIDNHAVMITLSRELNLNSLAFILSTICLHGALGSRLSILSYAVAAVICCTASTLVKKKKKTLCV